MFKSAFQSDRGTCFMSKELCNFLNSQGVNLSRTTPHSPQGNGQCERYSGIIWKGILLPLKSKNLHTMSWEHVLPDVLHSTHSLLCTSNNATPHEKLFGFSQRFSNGYSVPTWLTN
ncbi:uncharacterized protein LOC136089807 [Hydra vulgaris]|uniref:Uncharacterized protein LOC136089807 n=1 Tax=Hydra vulgaris TaxID=6087 RepID=A0ABM4DC56_HYDVU